MRKTLILALAGALLAATPALAQPAPNTGRWMTAEKAGQWRASKLTGLNVYNNANEKVGDVNELIIGKDGRVEAVVIGVGGFLGLGERNVAVPPSDLKWVDQPRATSTTAPSANPPAGTAPRAEPSTRADAARAYPDHAVLNVTKDQLKAAPEFKYAR